MFSCLNSPEIMIFAFEYTQYYKTNKKCLSILLHKKKITRYSPKVELLSVSWDSFQAPKSLHK